MTKAEATKRGRELRDRMKGKGWKLEIHRGICYQEWRYSVYNGSLYVWPHGENFCVSLGERASTCVYADPNVGVLEELKLAQRNVARIQAMIEPVQRLVFQIQCDESRKAKKARRK